MLKDFSSKAASLLLICFFLGNDMYASVNAIKNFEGIISSTSSKNASGRVAKERNPRPGNTSEKAANESKKVAEEPAGKPLPPAEAVVFKAPKAVSYLGSHGQSSPHLPKDDFFSIEVEQGTEDYKYAYLRYSTEGLSDAASLPKSINGHPVYAGRAIEKGDGRRQVLMRIEKSELQPGTNHIRFALPRGHNIPVSVKNVALLFSNEYEETTSTARMPRQPAEEADFRLLESPAGEMVAYEATDIDMPAVPGNMRNLTRNNWGYLSRGSSGADIKVSIGVNEESLLRGTNLSEVRIFYFDKEALAWKTARIENIDAENANLEGTVPGNTDYFAGLIKNPEMPEASAFVPTAISDIKAADPSAEMNIMQPPSVSRTGEARINYPLDIPKGRAGMQPDLALNYSSDGGTGVVGLGWSLNTPTVSIDTRWGVPGFSDTEESEVYLLNGKSLSMEGGYKANRGTASVLREDGARFFERTMSSYKEIHRHGDGPDTYVWTEVLADQTTYYYGTTDGTTVHGDYVLTAEDEDGHEKIVRWYLSKVEDKWGNTIQYSYAKHVNSLGEGITEGAVSMVVSGISYTGFQQSQGKYSVEFDYSGARADATVSLKSGLKEIDDKRLDKITVYYDKEGPDEKIVKEFKLNYANGPDSFFKTLLTSIEEWRGGTYFYQHDLEYHDGSLTYGDMEEIDVNIFAMTPFRNIPEELNQVLPVVGDMLNPSPIKTTATTGFSAGGALGLGFALGPWAFGDKYFTLTGRMGYSETHNRDVLSLNDMNGDGLPDLVFDIGGSSSYYPLQIADQGDMKFGGGAKTVNSGGRLLKSNSRTTNYGFDFSLPLGVFYYGMNWSKTRSRTSTFLTDFNSDGVSDIVRDGNVYFGDISAMGSVNFSTSSENTRSPVIRDQVVVEDNEDEAIKDLEIVKIWEAPFDGNVEISGLAEIASGLTGEVEIGIQLNNGELSTATVSSGNSATTSINETVNKGDKILFRTKAGNDGQQDLLNWNPRVYYPNISGLDANGLDYADSKYEEGFLLSGKEGVSFMGDQAVQVDWSGLSIDGLTDDVVLQISLSYFDASLEEYQRASYKYVVQAGTTVNPSPGAFTPAPAFLTGMSTVPGADPNVVYTLDFEVWSTSNVDWKTIDWRPTVQLGSEPCGKQPRISYPSVLYNTYNRLQEWEGTYPLPGSTSNHELEVWPTNLSQDLDATAINQIFDAPGSHQPPDAVLAYLVVKSGSSGSLLSKMAIRITDQGTITYHPVGANGLPGTQMSAPGTNGFNASGAGGEIFIDIFAPNRALGQVLESNLSSISVHDLDTDGSHITTKFNIFTRDMSELQDYQLHWGQFCWSGDAAGHIPVEELQSATKEFSENNDFSDTDLDEEQDLSSHFEGQEENLNPIGQSFFPLIPMRGEKKSSLRHYIKNGQPVQNLDRWSAFGLHIGSYAKDGATAPGKLGEMEEEPATAPPALTPYSAVASSQASKSASLAITSGNGFLTASITEPSDNRFAQSLNMFMDLNGDGYPDIVRSHEGKMKVNLTNTRGGHGGMVTYDNDGILTKTLTSSEGLAAPGNFVNEDGRFTKLSPLSGAANFGNSSNEMDWVDINGDGLVDKAQSSGDGVGFRLNTGSGLLAPAGFAGSGSPANSYNGSASLSVDIANLDNEKNELAFSFSAGVGINALTSGSQKMFMDLNGDGLPDKIEVNSNEVRISLNRGTDFQFHSAVEDIGDINETVGTGLSATVAGTAGITLGTWLAVNWKSSISGNGGVNAAMNELKSSFMDMDGDGKLDLVKANNDGNLEVYFNQTGKKNLLKKVSNPLKGYFTIDYESIGNKYGHHPVKVKNHFSTEDEPILWDMPESKWVMSKVTVNDGLFEKNGLDGEDKVEYKFNYDGGLKSRREREFLGFSRTETVHPANVEDPSVSEKIYITEVNEYTPAQNNNAQYRRRLEYIKDLLINRYTLYNREAVEDDPKGNPVLVHDILLMEEENYEYRFGSIDISPKADGQYNEASIANGLPEVVDWSTISETACIFPALATIRKTSVPQVASPGNFHAEEYNLKYDELLNVVEYKSEGVMTQGSINPEIIGSYERIEYVEQTRQWNFPDLIDGGGHPDDPENPFGEPFYENPRTGDKCYLVPGDGEGFSPDTVCLSDYFDLQPCSEPAYEVTEEFFFTHHRKPETTLVDIVKNQYSPLFKGPIIAKMTYFPPGSNEDTELTNMLKTHKIYLGSDAPENLERFTEVDALQNRNAPSRIKNHLNDTEYAQTDLTYDTKGNLTQITGPENHDAQRLTTDFSYDTETEQFVTSVVNSYGDEICNKYDQATGKLLGTIDINGHPTQYEYDGFHRLKTVWGPYEILTSGRAATITFDYYPDGIDPGNGTMKDVPVAITTHNKEIDVTWPVISDNNALIDCGTLASLDGRPSITNELKTATFMDGMQRVVQVKKDASTVNSAGDDNELHRQVSGMAAYDRLGREVSFSQSVAESEADSIGMLNKDISGVIMSKTEKYDYANRPIRQLDIKETSGYVTTMIKYDWDDLDGSDEFYTQQSRGGMVTRSYTNSLGQNIANLQESSAHGDVITGFEYDALNQLLAATNPLNQKTSYTYDHFGRMVEEDHPDRGETTFEYDIAGNLTQKATTLGSVDYEYDYKRLVKKIGPIALTSSLPDPGINEMTYTYGSHGDGKNGAGRVVGVVQGDGYIEESYSYDALGNLYEEEKVIEVPQAGPRTFTTRFGHDSWGRMTAIEYPDGDIVEYHYAPGGELESIDRSNGISSISVVEKILYNDFGNMKSIEYGNGTQTDFAYSTRTRRLTDLNLQNGSNTLLDKKIGYDNRGNVSFVANTAGPVNGLGGDYHMEYHYDDLNRLSHLDDTESNFGNDGYQLVMAYNEAGGITSKQQSFRSGTENYNFSYGYNSEKPHQIKRVQLNNGTDEGRHYEYNDAGSVTGIYKYVELQEPCPTAPCPEPTEEKQYLEEFAWNVEQNLTGAKNNSGIHHYLYDHNGERIMKSSVRGMSGGTDGEGGGIALDIDPYTVYANPYFVATHYQETVEATKHYYMGSQRVSSEMSSEPFVRAGGPQDVPEGPLAPEDMDPAFQDLLLLLEGFGKEQGEDYDLDEMAGMASYETLYPESEYHAVTGECEDEECPCEHSLYWAKNSGTTSEGCVALPILYWYHPDYLGNTEFITDHAGEPYQFFFYSPWGEALVDQHSSSGSYETPFRFNGKELDAETGNYYYGARYYDPKVSVWLSVDPFAHLYPTASPYAYVLNNPVNLTDPDGRSARCESCPDDEEFDFFRNSPTEYEYDEETDEVTRVSGGDLDEVTVTGELTLRQRGNLWMKENMKYSYADAERLVVEEKGYDYELYRMMIKLNQALEFPEESNTTSQAEDLGNMAAFMKDYATKSDAYNEFAKEYTHLLLSDRPMLEKVNKIKSLVKKYEAPNVTRLEIENKFYELNPALDYLRDE